MPLSKSANPATTGELTMVLKTCDPAGIGRLKGEEKFLHH